MGAIIFIYVFFVWFLMPIYAFDAGTKWFCYTWATWVIFQLIILNVLNILKKRSDRSGGSFPWFIAYFCSSLITLLATFCVPYIAGSIESKVISNYAEETLEEVKTQLEEELPELIKHFDARIDAKIQVEQGAPAEESDSSETASENTTNNTQENSNSQDYYSLLVSVDAATQAPNGYLSPDSVQKLYQEIYHRVTKIMGNSPSHERYRLECVEYGYADHVNVREIRYGILINVNCPGYSYVAESNSDFSWDDPVDYVFTVTDEISGKVWGYENSSSTGMTKEERERAARRKASEEAESKAAEERSKKDSNRGSSSVTHNYSVDGGQSAYDKGYEDVDINGEYNEYRYEHDLDYALGVDDAMEDRDEWY